MTLVLTDGAWRRGPVECLGRTATAVYWSRRGGRLPRAGADAISARQRRARRGIGSTLPFAAYATTHRSRNLIVGFGSGPDVPRLSWDVFAGVLNDEDARRATEVIEDVRVHGIRCALTGGLAIDAQRRKHGRAGERRSLKDIDFVVQDFASLAGAFLQHHAHPDATGDRMLLQLVDRPRAVRIDLFRALGASLSRASRLTATAPG